MTQLATGNADQWCTVSLFYVLVPREGDDSADVTARAELVFGEGVITPQPAKADLRVENLGDQLRLLRVSGRLADIVTTLTQETFDRKISRNSSRVERFTFGLVRRPPIVGLPGPAGLVGSPISNAYRVTQLVRTDKLALLGRIAKGHGDTQSERDFVGALLDTLARFTAVDLRSEEVHWLGDVLLAHPRKGPVWWTSVASEDRKSCKALDVVVSPGFSQSVHVQVRINGLDGLCICDRLLEWRSGDALTKRVSLDEELGTVFLRAWIDSELAVEEQSALLRAFSTRVDLVASTFNITDRLTEKLARTSGTASDTLERARQGQSTGMTVRVESQMNEEPWSGRGVSADALLEFLLPRPPRYSHFPRNPEGRAEAILNFARLVAEAERAYLVDPWFDAIGAEALLTRLRGDVRFTILTNLPSTTGAEVELLRELLKNLSVAGLPEHLEIVRLSGTRPEDQVFHDRFLLLQRSGRWQGFALTNSFSGLATKYPLFVVQTSLGLTALVLGEIERLTGSAAIGAERIWPPMRPQAPPPAVERGLFPRWRLVLRGLVPRLRLGAGDKDLLRAANALGFISLNAERISWRVSPAACATILSALLDGVVSRSVTFPRFRRIPRRRVHSRIGTGQAVLILGDLVARGLPTSAGCVARMLRVGSAHEIEVALRATFRDPGDLTRVAFGMSLDRVQLRQSIAAEDPVWRGVRTGMALWGSHLRERSQNTSWTRCFGYAVLLNLDPKRAVRLCEELADPDLVMSLVGLLHRRIDEPTREMATALAESRLPTLRGLGVQALVADAPGQAGSIQVARPADVAAAVRTLDEIALAPFETVYCLASWGHDHPSSDIASALSDRIAALPRKAATNVLDLLFDEEIRSIPFLEILVGALIERTDTTATLQALVDHFAIRFHAPRTSAMHFSGNIDGRLTKSIAIATGALATRLGVSASDEVARATRRDEIEAELVPLTPFRWRPSTDSADVALGWVLLWEFLASAGPPTPDGFVEVPDDVIARARAYVASKRLGQSQELRDVLTRALGSAST